MRGKVEPMCHLFVTVPVLLERRNHPKKFPIFLRACSTTRQKTTSNRKGPKERNRGRDQQEKGAAEEPQEGTQNEKHDET